MSTVTLSTLVDMAFEAATTQLPVTGVCLGCNTKTNRPTCKRAACVRATVVPLGTVVFKVDVHYHDPAHRRSNSVFRITREQLAKELSDWTHNTTGWEVCSDEVNAAMACIQLSRQDGLITIFAERA